ncbi:MAG: M56 family metallopeptidase [Thermodesulfobacteriota bacterium]
MVLLLLSIFIFVTGISIWSIYSLPDLLAQTYALTTWCHHLFTQCLAYYGTVKLITLWGGFILLAGGVIYASIKRIYLLMHSHRTLKRLPLSDRRLSVVLIRDDRNRVAFTHGLFRPRIYLSTGLLKGLERKEVEAVFMHELHHRRRRDPLKFFIMAFIRDIFFYVPIGEYLVRYIRTKKEYEADDAALLKPGGVLGLSTALLKVARWKNSHTFDLQPASIGGIGSVEGRIRRLVEGAEVGLAPPTMRSALLSGIVVLLMTLSFSMPLFASSAFTMKDCKTERCSVHKSEVIMDSMKHCDEVMSSR